MAEVSGSFRENSRFERLLAETGSITTAPDSSHCKNSNEIRRNSDPIFK